MPNEGKAEAMKKSLCILLAAIFLASVLAACAVSPTATVGSRVRITSSDAADAAAWLTERLGDRLTDSVVVGTDADGYGVDLASLEADGFFIRACGGEDVLLAKTTDGLDRAARKYAKMVEAGAVSDVTYHEGYRVKSLTIDTPDETPGLGTKVSEEKSFADQFIGKKGPFEFGKDGIEALTGATVTSQAALDALNSLYKN